MRAPCVFAVCVSRPAVLDGIVYLSGGVDAVPGDASKPEGFDLFALNAKTGQERWRRRAEAEYGVAGVCLAQPVMTAATIYAAEDSRLYAIDRASVRDQWKAIETRGTTADGQPRSVEVVGLVDAGAVLIGMTETALLAYDKSSGKKSWEVPGTSSSYRLALLAS